MGVTQHAESVLTQIRPLLPADAQGWKPLLLEGDMKEILSLTNYLVEDQQEAVWLLALDNLSNSEDAAALADFYRQIHKARLFFNKQKRHFIHKLLQACSEEIERTDDPDHLNAIMNDLYRIEEVAGANISAQKHFIYLKLEGSFFDNNFVTYYQNPELKQGIDEVAVQISYLADEIDLLFLSLSNDLK